jgi:3D-(3,5/4)-trihydroxycyclohexane-1,2-dione acylhydrolase (decyclizing)
MVGDGSWLMMPGELVTAVQEHVKVIVVLIDNRGYASIGSLSEHLGSDGFGTQLRARGADGQLSDEALPIDLAANARSLGAAVIEARSASELREALTQARDENGPTVVYVPVSAPPSGADSEAWWDVPVAETADVAGTLEARRAYEQARAQQILHVRGR